MVGMSSSRACAITRALTTLVLGVTAFHAGADEQARPEVKLEREGDCYRFATFDEWQKFLVRRAQDSPGFSAERFRARFTREQFDEGRKSIRCAFFTYSIDGVDVDGFSARPKSDTPLPVIIYNKGGAGDASAVTFGQMLEEIFPLAQKGYLVIGTQYRQQDEFGGKDVDDVMALLELIDGRSDAIHEQIGMMGWSRGGIMTMLAASRTARLKAVILGATPTDLLKGLESRPDMENVFKQRIPDYETRKADALRERSPLFLLDKIDPQLPILILHGAADGRAPAEHALELASSLQRKKHPYALKIYANGDHGLTAVRRDVLEECAGWFGSYLSTTIEITPQQERKRSAGSGAPSGR